MRPAFRPAVVSKDVRVPSPTRKLVSRFSAGNASLPGRLFLPHVFFVSVARCVTGRCCTRRCALAVRHTALRCSRVSLPVWRIAKMQPTLLRRAAASEDATLRARLAKLFPLFFAGNASLPSLSLSPHVLCASVGHGVTGPCCKRLCDLAVRHAT